MIAALSLVVLLVIGHACGRAMMVALTKYVAEVVFELSTRAGVSDDAFDTAMDEIVKTSPPELVRRFSLLMYTLIAFAIANACVGFGVAVVIGGVFS